MEIITVHTTQNIDIDYEVGGLGERILAYVIDIAIFTALAIIGGILAANVLSSTGIGIYFIILGLMLLFYDLVCETFFNGQSIGKLVMKIRVISLDGTRPKFSQYLLRWLFRMVDFSITSYLAGLVTIIVTDKGQRIGDIVAGTVVIRTKTRTTMSSIIFSNAEDTYQPVFSQAARLKEEEISLIHEVIENYFKTGSNMAVYKMADRIREHLSISLPPGMNSMQFLQTIIKDYSHITAQTDMV
ncbi:MAG: RDD family protein [Sphingobacteriales bacterium]